MNVINLDSLEGIRKEYLVELTKFDSLLNTFSLIEDFEGIQLILDLPTFSRSFSDLSHKL